MVQRSQPRGMVRVNRKNPIVRGLLCIFIGSAAYDPVTGRQITNTVARSRTLTPMGMAADGRLGQARIPVNGPSLANGSMFAVAYSNSTTQEQIVVEIGPASTFASGARGIRLFEGKVSTYWRNFTQINSPAPYAVDSPIIVGATYAGASTALYVDGALVASGNTTASTASAVVFNICGSVGNTSFNLRGTVPVAYAWNRVLEPWEHAALARNPYQLIEDVDEEDDELFRTIAALNKYTMTAAPGAFGLAGAPSALRTSRKLAGGNGSFTLTGAPAGMRAGRKVTAAAGVITLAAADVSLKAGRKLAAARGSVSMNGAAASFSVARRLAAGPGTFGLAGGAALLVAARRLPAASGSFALVGQTAVLVHADAPAPGGPTYVLSAAPGSFTVAGAPTVLVVARRAAAGTGAFGITAPPVAMSARRRLSAAPGDFNVAGPAALLQVARRLPATAGTFMIAGSEVSFKHSAQVEYTRAPAGAGYTPRRSEYQVRPQQGSHQARRSQTGSARPTATQKAYR